MSKRKDAAGQRKSRLAELPVIFAILTVLLTAAWWLSTPLQRKHYLEALGFVSPAPRRETSAPNSGPVILPYIPDRSFAYRSETTTHGIGSPCRRQDVANPSKAQRLAIHRWTDEQGQTHFGDEPPTNVSTHRVGVLHRGGNENYSATYDFIGFTPDSDTRNALRREIDTVFRFFENQLKFADVPPLHVNLVVISGKRQFVRYRKKHASQLTTLAGFYDYGTNEAVVRWKTADASLPTVRHEIAHLVIGNGFGNTPVWFSEGFSEVFERLAADQNALTARLDARALALLEKNVKAGSLPSVRWLVQSTRDDWKRMGGQAFYYGYSWAVLHYLLSTSDGKRALQAYISYLSQNRCQTGRNDSAKVLDAGYAGGLEALDAGLKRWLLKGRAKPLYY